jgi:hypothetical protein
MFRCWLGKADLECPYARINDFRGGATSHDPPSLLKNVGAHENWILLNLVGTKSNRSAIGAVVTVITDGHKQSQEIRSGGGYISQSDFRLHFGLGVATKADLIEIHWPSGLDEKFQAVLANQILLIKEGCRCSTVQRITAH